MCVRISNSNNCLHRTPVLGKPQMFEQLFLFQKYFISLVIALLGVFILFSLFCGLTGSVLGQYIMIYNELLSTAVGTRHNYCR